MTGRPVAENKIVIYESTFCPYCTWAKRLLDSEGVPYTRINVDRDRNTWSEMVKLSGRQTVPQIFFGDCHIGGYDDLSAMKQNGSLDPLISKYK